MYISYQLNAGLSIIYSIPLSILEKIFMRLIDKFTFIEAGHIEQHILKVFVTALIMLISTQSTPRDSTFRVGIGSRIQCPPSRTM